MDHKKTDFLILNLTKLVAIPASAVRMRQAGGTVGRLLPATLAAHPHGGCVVRRRRHVSAATPIDNQIALNISLRNASSNRRNRPIWAGIPAEFDFLKKELCWPDRELSIHPRDSSGFLGILRDSWRFICGGCVSINWSTAQSA